MLEQTLKKILSSSYSNNINIVIELSLFKNLNLKKYLINNKNYLCTNKHKIKF